MSEPIVEQISAWLVAAIAEITEANGYKQTLDVVRPEDLTAAQAAIGDLTAIVELEDPEPLGPRTRAGVRWSQPFGIITYIVGRGGSGLSVDKRINRVRSDIEKRLGTEIANAAGPCSLCSGLADDIEIRAPEIWIDTESQTTCLLCHVAISYRTSATDPYSQA